MLFKERVLIASPICINITILCSSVNPICLYLLIINYINILHKKLNLLKKILALNIQEIEQARLITIIKNKVLKFIIKISEVIIHFQ